jgi:hypothetical protein
MRIVDEVIAHAHLYRGDPASSLVAPLQRAERGDDASGALVMDGVAHEIGRNWFLLEHLGVPQQFGLQKREQGIALSNPDSLKSGPAGKAEE